MSTIKTNFHRVCNQQNTTTHIDPNRSKTYKNNLSILLSLFKQYNHTLNPISSFINMLTVLIRFIIHLFIIIYNLLYIYSFLFIFFIVYIFYYFLLFLGGVIWKWELSVITVFYHILTLFV